MDGAIICMGHLYEMILYGMSAEFCMGQSFVWGNHLYIYRKSFVWYERGDLYGIILYGII